MNKNFFTHRKIFKLLTISNRKKYYCFFVGYIVLCYSYNKEHLPVILLIITTKYFLSFAITKSFLFQFNFNFNVVALKIFIIAIVLFQHLNYIFLLILKHFSCRYSSIPTILVICISVLVFFHNKENLSPKNYFP